MNIGTGAVAATPLNTTGMGNVNQQTIVTPGTVDADAYEKVAPTRKKKRKKGIKQLKNYIKEKL